MLLARAVAAAAVGSWAARRVCHVHQSSQHAVGVAHCRQIHGSSSERKQHTGVIYQQSKHITRAARFVVACASDSKQRFLRQYGVCFWGTAGLAEQTWSSSSSSKSVLLRVRAGTTVELEVKVEGMKCGGCSSRVEATLKVGSELVESVWWRML